MHRFEYRGFWIQPDCVFNDAHRWWEVVVRVGKPGREEIALFAESAIYRSEKAAVSAALVCGKRRVDRQLLLGDGGLGGF